MEASDSNPAVAGLLGADAKAQAKIDALRVKLRAANKRARNLRHRHKIALAEMERTSFEAGQAAARAADAQEAARCSKTKATGTKRDALYRHDKIIDAAFRGVGISSTEVRDRLFASSLAKRGLDAVNKFVEDVDARLEGQFFKGSDMKVVKALEDAVDAHLAHTIKMVGPVSLEGWDRQLHVLCSQRNKEDTDWEPRLVQVAGSRVVPFPWFKGKWAVAKWAHDFFGEMEPMESDDQAHVILNVVKGLRRVLNRAEMDMSLPPIPENADATERIHISGDAATLFRHQDGTMVVARALGDRAVNTQTPRSLQLLLYTLGHDDYEVLSARGKKVWDSLRQIADKGLPLTDEPDAPCVDVDFEETADWPFNRNLLGQCDNPGCDFSCWLCKTAKADFLKWVDHDDVPVFPMRDIDEEVKLSHDVGPDVTADTFVPFTCPAPKCNRHFASYEEVVNHRAMDAPADYLKKHFSHKKGRVPLVTGWLKDVRKLRPCLLHVLLNLLKNQFDASIRYPASVSRARCDAVNAYLTVHKITFRHVEFDDSRKPRSAADWRRGHCVGGGVIGADCVRIMHEQHFINLLTLAWDPEDPDSASGGERADLFGEWLGSWGELTDLWRLMCTHTKPGDKADYKLKARAVLDQARAFLRSFKYAGADEKARLYMHLLGHLYELMCEAGCLVRFAGEGLEHANSVMRKLARLMSSRKQEGNMRKNGTRGRGLACQLACAFFGLQDAWDHPAVAPLRRRRQKRRTAALWPGEEGRATKRAK